MVLRSKFGERIGSPPIITIRFYPQTWVSPTLSMLKTLLIVMIQAGTWRNLINTSFLLILFKLNRFPSSTRTTLMNPCGCLRVMVFILLAVATKPSNPGNTIPPPPLLPVARTLHYGKNYGLPIPFQDTK